MKKILSLVALFLLSGSLAKADMMACTQMWCQEGMTVNLQGTEWPAGDYIFKIKADEKEFTCNGKLPFPDCDTQPIMCDVEGVSIGASGCALPKDQHSFHMVMMHDANIKHINLDIIRGDGKKFTFSSDVAAQCSFPNGEQCDSQQCCSAVLDAPVVWN